MKSFIMSCHVKVIIALPSFVIQDEMIVCMKIIMMYLRTLITKKKQRRDIEKRDVKFGFILMMNSCGKLKYCNLEGIQLRGQNSIE